MAKWKVIERVAIPGSLRLSFSDSPGTFSYACMKVRVTERDVNTGEARFREENGPAMYASEHPDTVPFLAIARTVWAQLLPEYQKMLKEEGIDLPQGQGGLW